jgi:TonB family protein
MFPAAAQQGTPGTSAAKPPAEEQPQATKPADAMGSDQSLPVEILSDTQGVDFKPYLAKVLDSVRKNWYKLIPEEARPPLLKQGKVTIQFAILPDGKVSGMQIVKPSGDTPLDRAAWGGITACNPFDPLPSEFHGPFLALRFHFYYNPPKGTVKESQHVP